MELHQVRYFLALCEELNFTRAAARCGVSQPSLTRAIKTLEAELGGPLFDRDRAGTRLSDLGVLLRPELVSIERARAEAARKATKFRSKSFVKRRPKARKKPMRILSLATVALALLIASLVFRPTQSASVSPPAQADVTIDPSALQLTVDVKSLPEQITGDLI